ncbi:MAG: histidinol dehydrogenase [Crocosphaera sp.]
MGICQQKWLTTLSFGIIFSLTGVVSAKAATVSYEAELNGGSGNVPPRNIAGQSGGFATFGYQFSVMPDPTDVNFEMTAFGVFASLDNLFTPENPDDYFVLPELSAGQSFAFPENVHEVGLWEVNSDGTPLSLDPIRRVTINPSIMIEDPDNSGSQIEVPNPSLGFVDGFAYFSLDDPDDPVTPDNELDDIFTLSGSEQFFRLGVTYTGDVGDFETPPADQAWIDSNPPDLFGDVVIPNQNLDGVPNEGAAVDPMLMLAPNIDGDDQPQGYYGIPDDATIDELAFPDQETYELFPGFPNPPGSPLVTNPFFVAGNILFGPLPPGFPISATTTGGTTTGGTTTGGTTTGGVPTIPEPSLIHGLLAITLGGIVTRYKQGKVRR